MYLGQLIGRICRVGLIITGINCCEADFIVLVHHCAKGIKLAVLFNPVNCEREYCVE